jgi:NADH pyrophosphatase NudC (nudix superfamily)
MEDLKWTQAGSIVSFSLMIENEEKIFRVNPKIVNFLASHTPKIFYFDVYYKSKKFHFLADMRSMKPVIAPASRLSVRISSKKNIDDRRKDNFEDYFTISRGESFSDRFLGINGWQTQEYRFELKQSVNTENVDLNDKNFDVRTKIQTIRPESFKSEEKEKVSLKIQSEQKAKKCKNCGAIIDDDVDFCPHCFSPLFDKEDGVDYAL